MTFNGEVKSVKLGPSQVCELTMAVEDADPAEMGVPQKAVAMVRDGSLSQVVCGPSDIACNLEVADVNGEVVEIAPCRVTKATFKGKDAEEGSEAETSLAIVLTFCWTDAVLLYLARHVGKDLSCTLERRQAELTATLDFVVGKGAGTK
jgi:hypothetical protein